VPHVQRIIRTESAFGKRQIMDGIEQIGFTASIFPKKALDVTLQIQSG
jgi:hypothetical protein